MSTFYKGRELFVRPGEIQIGSRVELSPATDLWMRGARFGEVRKIVESDDCAEEDVIHIRMDHPQVKKLARVRYADLSKVL